MDDTDTPWFKLLLVLAILVLVGATIVLLLAGDNVDIAKVGILAGPLILSLHEK